ncbi:Mitochondrial intermediate peptidase, partial [Serendipita sp. 398]
MLLRRPFRFRGCLVTKSQQRRAHTASIIPVTTHDHTLRDFFDQPHKPLLRGTNVPIGLLGYPQIASPESFVPVTAATMARANYIVRRIIQAGNNEGERMRIVKNIDRLSDLLCGVIDMAELIRHTHPERAWVDAANQAYDTLCEYMNHLNTNVDLARALDDFMASPSFKNLPMEAKQTAWIFKHDFDKSGVHLPIHQRQKFVELSSNIISLGRDFLQGLGAEKKPIMLFTKDCEGVPETPRLWQLYSVKRGLRSRVSVEPNSAEARRVLKHSTNEEARKKVYVSQNASSNEQIQVLEQLLRDRAELAVLVGRQSYGEMLLHDKMGKKPEHVHEFLGSLLEFSRPRALAALNDVKQAKKRSQGLSYLPEIYAWDREAYFPSKSLEPPIPLPRLTPGLALCAFSRLLKHIYGISCEPADVERGEVWHDDVRKVNIVDESEGIIGWIYLDLFYREGKAGGATHYTLRCSRRVDDDDAANDFLPSDHGRELTPDLEERLVIRSESHVTPGRDGSHQRPVAAISCDFDAN